MSSVDRQSGRGWCVECGKDIPVLQVNSGVVLAKHIVLPAGVAEGAGTMAPKLGAQRKSREK